MLQALKSGANIQLQSCELEHTNVFARLSQAAKPRNHGGLNAGGSQNNSANNVAEEQKQLEDEGKWKQIYALPEPFSGSIYSMTPMNNTLCASSRDEIKVYNVDTASRISGKINSDDDA